MNILLLLIPLSLLLLGAAVWMFVWAVRRGQFEDLDTPALDILREDAHDRPLTPAPVEGGTDAGAGGNDGGDKAGGDTGTNAGEGGVNAG